jgi:hypothetical protein
MRIDFAAGIKKAGVPMEMPEFRYAGLPTTQTQRANTRVKREEATPA